MTAEPYIASGGADSPLRWNPFAYAEGDAINNVGPEVLKSVAAILDSLS